MKDPKHILGLVALFLLKRSAFIQNMRAPERECRNGKWESTSSAEKGVAPVLWLGIVTRIRQEKTADYACLPSVPSLLSIFSPSPSSQISRLFTKWNLTETQLHCEISATQNFIRFELPWSNHPLCKQATTPPSRCNWTAVWKEKLLQVNHKSVNSQLHHQDCIPHT